MGKDFLGQDRGRNRADMAARFGSFDNQRINPGFNQLFSQRQRRGKTHDPGAAVLDFLDRTAGRQAASQDHMRAVVPQADLN